MDQKERTKRDLAIGMDFIEDIIQKPQKLDDIPHGAMINFIDSAHPKTETKAEQKLNRKYVKVKRKFELL